MFRNILIIITSGIVSLNGFGQGIQDIIAGSGDHFANEQISLSWTLGEPVSETIGSSSIFLTQGFLQSRLLVTSIKSPIPVSVKVYPNPTSDQVQIEHPSLSSYLVRLSTYQGQTLRQEIMVEDSKLDVTDLVAGMYFLSVHDFAGRWLASFRIIKL
ncbi:MAG: T9SS type A sorting domain-containing protein [Saprospiraceae bacterium]|nr:T9SS type A sorting domain-containing protein [Saprospiraceae bacterium]